MRFSLVNEHETQPAYFDAFEIVHKPNAEKLTVTSWTDYYPFGKVAKTACSGAGSYRYGYQGEFSEKDNETDWNSFELRQYDSEIGRFTTTDPMGEFWSSYVGMGNDPVNLTDPTGGETEPGDDYFIRKNGEVVVRKTDYDFDRFYIEKSLQTLKNGDVVRTYEFVAQLERNSAGYLPLPDKLETSSFAFSYVGNTNERYIAPEAFAALIGAMAQTGYCDINFNHWSNADGSTPPPSRSHKDGIVGDVRPLRLDRSGQPILTTDAQFDSARNTAFIASLNTFGWKGALSERNPATGWITPLTTHYSGYRDKKTGKWIDVRHNNHYHIQNFKPQIIKPKLSLSKLRY